MSRYVTKEGDKYIEEIADMEVCKWSINDVCCNEKCEWLGSYSFSGCNNRKLCEYFKKEDGIIEV